MSGFAENMAHDAPDRAARPDAVVNLATALKMLPLVSRIVQDILVCQRELAKAEPELARLDRLKRTLSWPDRSLRYRLQEEVLQSQANLEAAVGELESLNIPLFDRNVGRVGFPTIVNNRRAFFSWQGGEDGLTSWHFEDDSVRRPIPQAWYKAADIQLLNRS